MAEDDVVRLDTRLAGQIRRYHTWPIIGQQTIAEHTWQMLRIYMCVAMPTKINPAVVFRMMFHDVGEHSTGDLPFPVKRDNPALKAEVNMLEERSYATQLDYWDALHHAKMLVTSEEEVLIKQIEMIEMAEFGMDQVCFGNQHVFIVANRCLQAVYKITPAPCPRLIDYVIKRLALFFKQCPLRDVEAWYSSADEWWYLYKWEQLK
jgi:5'-deoxynucleotidase YfbR-like HD superfamily hydrolase